jgi:hypothetical protein
MNYGAVSSTTNLVRGGQGVNYFVSRMWTPAFRRGMPPQLICMQRACLIQGQQNQELHRAAQTGMVKKEIAMETGPG